MSAPRTTGSRIDRRRTATVAAAATLTLAGVALTAGAATAGATVGVTATSSATTVSAASPMTTLWAQTDAATRDAICTAFQLDPAGTWQTLAPVLVDAGVTRVEALTVLAEQCSPERSVKDLRG
jgi:hypothetical protein